MNKLANKKSGFTLIEVLVSVGIMLIFLPFAASMLVNSQLLASYSKHKIQAAYVAQQLIESQRQQPISVLAPKLAVVNPITTPITGAVTLDTKGDYNNLDPGNHFYGTAVITITPEVYTNQSGQTTNPPTAIFNPNVGAPYSYYITAHLGVKISWIENILNEQVSMNEYYSADIIVNDPMLN